jgi:hypothetical protein
MHGNQVDAVLSRTREVLGCFNEIHFGSSGFQQAHHPRPRDAGREWRGRKLVTATRVPPCHSQSSGSAMMPLAAGSELRDELLSLVQLAVEPVPLFGRALRERLARVAGVELADSGHALPLLGPELPYGRRPLRIAAPAFPSRPHESHPFDPVPVARVAPQRARLPRGMEGTSCIPVRPHRDQRPPLAMGRAYADECLGQNLVRLPRRETDRGSRRTRGTRLVVGSRVYLPLGIAPRSVRPERTPARTVMRGCLCASPNVGPSHWAKQGICGAPVSRLNEVDQGRNS